MSKERDFIKQFLEKKQVNRVQSKSHPWKNALYPAQTKTEKERRKEFIKIMSKQ